MTLEPLVDVDRYRLEAELARSWSGVVLRAHDVELGQDVALRRFTFAQPVPLARRTRFLRQLELLVQSPPHPHLLRVFDAGVDGEGCPYVVTELLEGVEPEPVLAGGAAIERVLRVGVALTRAVSHLHGLGVVHQALATDGLLRQGEHQLKLTGFGLACLEDLGQLLEATGGGGPRDPARRFCYLAPEQAGLRRGVGSAADLYAVGVILFELLTGRPPFADPDPGAVLHGHLAKKPPSLGELRPEAPEGLVALVDALLAKEPAQRPSGAELLGELRRLADDGSLGAAPDEADDPRQALTWAVPLVAREGELLALTAALGEAHQGRGRSVLLSGEAGRGKSRLIEALRERAQALGGRLIAGKCVEGTRPGPFDPFAKAVADYRSQLRGLPRSDRLPREELCERCPEVLTPAFAGAGAPTSLLPGGNDSRSDQFERCVEFLLALAAQEPVLVLAIDDLQWADEGTLQLFANLNQAAPATRLLVVGACRPAELNPYAEETLTRLRESELAPLALELGALDPGDAAQLVQAHLAGEGSDPTEVARAVVQAVGGNPLHLRQALQSLVELGGLTRRGDAWSLDPGALDAAALRAGVTEVIRGRAERLGDDVSAALARAAVIGRSFTLDLLVEITGLKPSHALLALERAQRAGFLEEETGRLVWNFTHDKVREALYAAVPAADLAGLHRAIADAILAEAVDALPDHAAELAYHYTQAGQTQAALRFHMLAGERAQAAFVLHAAADHFGWVLDHLDPEEEPLAFAQTVALYSSARRYAGDTARIRALLERALPIAVAHDDMPLEVELTGRLAMVAELAKSPDAVEWIRRFADVGARSCEPRAAVIARAMLGYHLFEKGDARQAIPELEACLQSSSAFAEGLDAGEIANLSAVLGYAYARTGRFEEGVARIQDAIAQAERIGRSVVGWTTTTLGALYLEWGMWEEGLPHHARARRILEETGDAFYLYLARATAGLGLVLAGDSDEGLRRLDEALAFGLSRGIRSYAHAFLCFGGEAELTTGRPAVGERRVRQALEDARAAGDHWTECRAQRVLSEWTAEQPDADDAALVDAERRALESLRRAEELALRPEVGRLQRALGKLYARRGQTAAASAAFAQARADLTACQMELDLALVPSLDGEPAPAAPLLPLEPAPVHDLLHRRGFQTIVRVSRMVGATLDLDALLDRALGAMIEVFGAERGFILLDEGQGLDVRAARGTSAEALDPEAREVVERVRRGESPPAETLADRSWLCAPIGAPPARAVVYLENRLVSDLLSGEDALVLEAIAAQVAVGIESAQAYREVARLKERLEQENVYLKEELASHAFPEIVGESPALLQALRRVEQVAPTEATVLLRGETGTGKELFARAIHDHSPRKGPLVRVNCSALPATLVASELFGHERGAFTGATTRRPGRFELARGGTLFLDEIGDVPLETQAALLRVLEVGEFERVGGTRTLRSDVRVVAATNRDLEAAVETGEFRRDLLYRLNGFTIEIPPLRERGADVPLLAQSFALAHARTLGKAVTELAPEALDALQAAPWPGNVRELKSVIERAVILAPGPVLTLGLFALTVEEPAPQHNGDDLSELVTLEEHERRYLRRVLEQTDWTIKGEQGAAKLLGIPPSTLTSRLKKLGLRRPARR